MSYTHFGLHSIMSVKQHIPCSGNSENSCWEAYVIHPEEKMLPLHAIYSSLNTVAVGTYSIINSIQISIIATLSFE